MRPDLDSLALFLRAIEHGSLSKAAVESHMVLSAASRRLAILEASSACRCSTAPPRA